MWIDSNNTIIKTPRSITIGDVTYPRQVFNDSALLETLGITPYEMPVQLNQRYYWNNETERDVADLKEQMISTIKSQVGSRLKSTDWMVIREMDGGTAMSADVKAYRTAIRAEGDAKEAEVNALVTLDDVMLYEATPFTEVRKVKHTSDEGIETYGPELEEPATRHIDMTRHYEAVDPNGEIDPAFVSLTKD